MSTPPFCYMQSPQSPNQPTPCHQEGDKNCAIIAEHLAQVIFEKVIEDVKTYKGEPPSTTQRRKKPFQIRPFKYWGGGVGKKLNFHLIARAGTPYFRAGRKRGLHNS